MARTPAVRALAVDGKGLSPICSSMTSLPWALRRLATASTSNAVSAVGPWANWLGRGVAVIRSRESGATIATGAKDLPGAPRQQRAMAQRSVPEPQVKSAAAFVLTDRCAKGLAQRSLGAAVG